eukprot:468731-Amorphochlora_amoeboformis.AAC.2
MPRRGSGNHERCDAQVRAHGIDNPDIRTSISFALFGPPAAHLGWSSVNLTPSQEILPESLAVARQRPPAMSNSSEETPVKPGRRSRTYRNEKIRRSPSVDSGRDRMRKAQNSLEFLLKTWVRNIDKMRDNPSGQPLPGRAVCPRANAQENDLPG